mmetsp:Transcript_51438/g.111677  ORF Transcript_51438/g.111677 Transcript_51438/m.111677 type:complete len:93 (-) Transcript_51438:46-324(-)
MIANRMFASRVLPSVASKVARPTMAAMPALLAQRAVPVVAPRLGALAVRGYGTRSVWNVKFGRQVLFVWLVVWTFVAFIVQEILGPYVFHHE